MNTSDPASGTQTEPLPKPHRWLCYCGTPPMVLATIDGPTVSLKIRDRYYQIEGGRIQAVCPRCGRQHTYPPAPQAT